MSTEQSYIAALFEFYEHENKHEQTVSGSLQIPDRIYLKLLTTKYMYVEALSSSNSSFHPMAKSLYKSAKSSLSEVLVLDFMLWCTAHWFEHLDPVRMNLPQSRLQL